MKNENGKYKYYAFISYKREDERWAKWLQKKLEAYGFPIALRKENPSLPSKIRPVFRDQSELSGGKLKEAIENGLKDSKYLIVICSPRAAKSPWVSKEVQYFIDHGREEYIIPFIIGGSPNASDPENECFPEGLRSLSGENEILGINISEMGRDAAVIKVIARMFDLRFDTLWQRHERSKRRVRIIILLSVLLFTFASLGIGAYMMYLNKQISSERDKTLEANWRMMEDRARIISSIAKQEIEKGNVYESIIALLNILPENTEKPYVPEIEEALRLAYDKLNSGEWLYTVLDGYCDQFYVTNNQKYLICWNNERIDVRDVVTDNIIYTLLNTNSQKESDLENSSKSNYVFESSDGKKLYWTDMIESFKAYDISNGSYLQSCSNRSSFTKDVIYPAKALDLGLFYGNSSITGNNEDFSLLLIKRFAKYYEEGEGFSYTLKDIKNNYDRFSLDNGGKYYGMLTDISRCSFSPDDSLMVLSFRNGKSVIYDSETGYPLKENYCMECDHYSNWVKCINNNTIIHSSRFENGLIVLNSNFERIDSVPSISGGEIVNGAMTRNGNKIWTVGEGEFCSFTKSVTNNSNSNIETLSPADLMHKESVSVGDKYFIECLDDKVICTNLKSGKKWTYSSNLGCSLLSTFDNNRLLIVRNYQRFYDDIVFLDISTGIPVYQIAGFEDVFFNKKTNGWVFTEEYTDKVAANVLPFKDVVAFCKSAVRGRKMTQKGKKLFHQI